MFVQITKIFDQWIIIMLVCHSINSVCETTIYVSHAQKQ